MIHKKLLSLLVLLMTAASGAWATVYNSGEVNSAVLKVGDILYDVTIGNIFKLAANRYKDQNGVQNVNSAPLVNIVIDADGLLYKKFRPVTADGQDGNAWVVTEKMSVSPNSGEVQVLLGGIIYNADSIYLATDAAKESDPFTEATFEMPVSDATVDYELVRDMAVQMTTKVGDGAEGADYRIRLKKKDSKWELADLNVQQVKALFKVHDAIENKDLVFYGDSAVCTVSIYALVLFEGFPVKVPGKEFVTYYRIACLSKNI